METLLCENAASAIARTANSILPSAHHLDGHSKGYHAWNNLKLYKNVTPELILPDKIPEFYSTNVMSWLIFNRFYMTFVSICVTAAFWHEHFSMRAEFSRFHYWGMSVNCRLLLLQWISILFTVPIIPSLFTWDNCLEPSRKFHAPW